jgi:hypothetical protein
VQCRLQRGCGPSAGAHGSVVRKLEHNAKARVVIPKLECREDVAHQLERMARSCGSWSINTKARIVIPKLEESCGS